MTEEREESLSPHAIRSRQSKGRERPEALAPPAAEGNSAAISGGWGSLAAPLATAAGGAALEFDERAHRFRHAAGPATV